MKYVLIRFAASNNYIYADSLLWESAAGNLRRYVDLFQIYKRKLDFCLWYYYSFLVKLSYHTNNYKNY